MKNEIKLSSDWTNFGLYGGSFVLLLMIPVFSMIMRSQEFHMGMVFGGLMFFIVFGFLGYQFIYVCDARKLNNKIVLKKKFRPAKSYTFDRIGQPSSFELKRTKYITVNMKNDDNSIEKYLIVNSTSVLSFENTDAEKVLRSLRNDSNLVHG